MNQPRSESLTKILLVDDDAAILRAMSEYLRGRGYEVDSAQEMEEAEALLEHIQYKIIVTDLSLGKYRGLEGLDLLDHLRKNAPSTRTIVLSGHDSEDVRTEAAGRGNSIFLGKPVSLSKLGEAISKLLEKNE